jgi:acetoin utilization deacetylase AcuC-like enzyme
MRTVATEVLLLFDETMVEHDPGPGHPERPQRLREIVRRLRDDPVEGTAWLAPHPVPRSALHAVHSGDHVLAIDALRGRDAVLDADTILSPASVEAAYLAAGAAVDAVTAVVGNEARTAFALVRPPGHHAEASEAMGFCLFNNIAVAAEYAVSELGLQRVLVIDWDVHHGNGTQHIFEHRDDVLLFSTHQYPFYPGTGAADETGRDRGAGFTVNVPLHAGAGDRELAAVFEQLLVPIADEWRPQLVLVSAGFDAHRDDPIGSMQVSAGGFANLCRTACDLAGRHAGARVALILEGGYDVTGLADSVHACVRTLAGEDTPPVSTDGHLAGPAIDAVGRIHRSFWPI